MSKKSSLKLYRILYFFIFALSLYFCLWSIQYFWNKIHPKPVLTPEAAIPPEYVDQSWYTDEPCEAPCWYGLQPGISSFDETISVIEDLPFIDSIKITENVFKVWDNEKQQNMPAVGYYGFCVQPAGHKCLLLKFSDNILKEIIIIPNQYFSISDMVETIGPPDDIYFLYSYPVTHCTIMLFWENRDTLMMHSFEPDHWYEYYFEFPGNDLCNTIMDNDYKIPRTLSVDSIYYQTKILSRYEAYYCDIRKWNGFLEE